MANLSIKDVPELWAEALRQRAARNHRSLQGELMSIIEQAIQQQTPTPAEILVKPNSPRISGYDKRGWPMVRQGWKTVDQVAAELQEKYPVPLESGPSSIDIIREDRDRR